MYLDILLDHQISLLYGTGNPSAKYFHKHKQFEIHRNTPYPTKPPTSSNSDMGIESDGHFLYSYHANSETRCRTTSAVGRKHSLPLAVWKNFERRGLCPDRPLHTCMHWENKDARYGDDMYQSGT